MDYVTISQDHSSACAQHQHFIPRENVEVRTTLKTQHEIAMYDVVMLGINYAKLSAIFDSHSKLKI